MNYETYTKIVTFVCLLGAGGWLANIYKLVTATSPLAEMGMMEVARVAGIFLFPLGAVLGFF